MYPLDRCLIILKSPPRYLIIFNTGGYHQFYESIRGVNFKKEKSQTLKKDVYSITSNYKIIGKLFGNLKYSM